MMPEMNSQSIIKAIKASIVNDDFCCYKNHRNKNITYKIKYSLWLITLILLSPYKKIETKKFICATTIINENRLINFTKCDEYFKFANLNKKLNQIVNNTSIFSPYNIVKRIKLYFNALLFYIKNSSDLKGSFCYAIEYYLIAFYLVDNCVTEIITSGNYERYCTLLSYLGEELNIKVIGVQDGAAIDISAPMKLYCDEMYVFDEFEMKIIRSLIKNDDCKYTCIGFHSLLKWDIYEKKGGIAVAIASQDWFTHKTIEIIDFLMSNLNSDNTDVIVFPHYREKKEQYENICKKYPKIILETKKRYSNIDLLITFYSTIVYDFWSVNKNIPVICLHIDGYEPSYYDRKNVYVAKDISEIKIYLNELLLQK